MITGRVIGRVWSTKRIDIHCHREGCSKMASSPTASAISLPSTRSAAVTAKRFWSPRARSPPAYFEGVKAPVDALIVGSIDESA